VVKAAEAMPDYNFHVFARMNSDHKGFEEVGRLLESAEILLPNLNWYMEHTQAQKCAYLRACDVALVPSINAAPFEITGLEAMLAGTPLITTAVCGMRDYCNDDNCTIIEPTAEALISAIKNHVRDQDKLRKAHDTAKAFSWDAAALKYKQFYERVYGFNLPTKHAA
jgi:glycosyltransferase involved in cell wall biosynthesis